MTVKNSYNKLTIVTLLLLVVGLLVVAGSLPAEAGEPSSVPLRADDRLLQDRAVQFLQQINSARHDPLAVVARLGLDEQAVREVFADDPSILDQGLPPLAWNDLLVESAADHGRDMFDRLYYSYTTPEGLSVAQRIDATGYRALFVGETMNALFFDNYMALDSALQLLVDTMLRDELTGTPGVERNIFSPNVSEVGVSFMAESIRLLDEQPYVYLLLADFAEPFEVAKKLLVEYNTGSRLVLRSSGESRWVYPQSLRDGLVQVDFPVGGGDLIVIGDNGLGALGENCWVGDNGLTDNVYLDLRTDSTVVVQ